MIISLQTCKDSDLTLREESILNSCLRFYNQEEEILDRLFEILKRTCNYSLRLVDWLCTNYSKRHQIIITYNDMPINIHSDYCRYLNAFNKKYFDPFSRRKRIIIKIDSDTIITTIGQLNFFRWWLQRDLHAYIIEHKNNIETDMRNIESAKKTMTHQFSAISGPHQPSSSLTIQTASSSFICKGQFTLFN
jgi:hypothetical protein